MNYMKEVAKLLGYEIGEEFNIIYDNGEYPPYNPFKFTETSLVDKDGYNSNDVLILLLTGNYTAEKIPFVPKIGEDYWTYSDGVNAPVIRSYYWDNDCYDKERKLLGILFKTEQEAKDYLPTWEKRLEGEEWYYENNQRNRRTN